MIEMIISRSQVQNLLKIYQSDLKKVEQMKETKPASSARDSLAISQDSRVKQKALQAIQQTPDIRTERVESLKEQISTGSYEVKSEEVAEKMIARAIIDYLV
ncbi:MAG TPA: flagellar biosynthesis anti-sigma factor FlgM [Syntrophomonadaceae bacterium]|nr:flagellar biosynthesis anti-sigma factor FlgM [Syntrophomonadaceae bacterium]